MHAKVFSIQIFQYFHQIPPRVCTLVLFIIKGDHDVQYGGPLETGISSCESCVSSGAWRHAPQIILFILRALKSLLIYFYCFFYVVYNLKMEVILIKY